MVIHMLLSKKNVTKRAEVIRPLARLVILKSIRELGVIPEGSIT